MYLFFDTETTGLPKSWSEPITNTDNWPRIVQLAWVLYDANGVKIDEKNHIIKADGFSIPLEASKIHGISNEISAKRGENIKDVLSLFSKKCIESSYVIAHNMSFDENVYYSEIYRAIKNEEKIPDIKKICTMKASTNYCRIVGQNGYKWPKLEELHKVLFGEDFSGAHNAMVDVQITAKCFFELKKRGIINIK